MGADDQHQKAWIQFLTKFLSYDVKKYQLGAIWSTVKYMYVLV